uniref:DUF4378 domain-containing protein n=1 Tax=Oryza rufipogon TaxID=4529 RepID=A0A0E0MR04_ORYRU
MSSLAIVEKRPAPFVGGGGGCAGGVLLHLLDWHRRLARKRRLFSPRRLLPTSLRSSPRRLPSPPQASHPPPAPRLSSAATAAGVAAPGVGVVARLMGLESWPATGPVGAPPAARRPQKQRKVEVASPTPRADEPDVVLVLPPSQRPPPLSPAARNHHGADLPARSPRRSRLVHAAATKLLEPSARASSRASARLALAYACSSPQHRIDGHSNALQSSSMPDDFLSRSDSLPLERSSRLQPVVAQPPVLPAETEWDNVITSSRHEKHSIDTISSSDAADVVSGDAIVVLRSGFDDANVSRSSSGADAMPKDHKARTDRLSNCSRMRSSGAGVRAGEERSLRKRGTHSLQDVEGNIGSRSLVSSTHPAAGSARELMSGSRRAAHHGSGQRRELMGTITPQRSSRREVMGSSNPQRNTRRSSIDRSGLTSTTTSRIAVSTVSGQKRGSRKNVGRDNAACNREVNNPVAFASSSSVNPVTRNSSQSKVSEKRGCRRTQVISTSCSTRLPVVESSPSVVGSSEKEEFSRLLKAKINELGLSDRIESSDALSGKLTASVLQELISALTNDTNTSDSQHSNYSNAYNSQHSNYSDAVDCLNNNMSACNSNDQSHDFQNCYQRDREVESSATCMNNEPNQPSPTSVLEACFSNDTSSLGSPTEKNEGKEYFVSIENKMEDLFNLESDIVDLAISIDKTKTDAEEIFHGIDKMSSVHNLMARDFKLLEARLHSIGEAISNAELLLGNSPLSTKTSNLSLHCFIIEMLEVIMDLFGGSKSLGLTEEKKYQQTNFIFDCIIESVNSKFCDFGKCGYKAWLRLPLSLTEDLLKREISKEICNWRETRETTPNRVAEKELDQMTPRWDACQVEAFDISIAIEHDILEALVDEFAFDQW